MARRSSSVHRHRAAPSLAGLVLVLIAAVGAYFYQSAGSLTGHPRVVDGDSLVMNGVQIRLYGIDAVELAQTCTRGGARWPCGAEALQALRRAIAGKEVTCRPRDTDRYGRVVAVCSAGSLDLGAAMVKGGYATAYGSYAADEREARDAGRGIWSSTFEPPAAYRARHPRGGGSS